MFYAHRGCIYLIKIFCNIVKYVDNLKELFSIVIYSCDGKAEFSVVITPVFSVTWSFRNYSNMWNWCSRNISDYYQCWKQFTIFVEIIIYWNRTPLEHCINVFTITFDQFITSLLNKNITFFKKNTHITDFILLSGSLWHLTSSHLPLFTSNLKDSSSSFTACSSAVSCSIKRSLEMRDTGYEIL